MPRGATSPSVQKRPQRAGSLRRCQERRELLAAARDLAVDSGTDSAATLAQRGFPIGHHTSASRGPDRPVEAPRAVSTRRRLYRSPGCQTAKAQSTAQWNTICHGLPVSMPIPGPRAGQFPHLAGPGASSRPAPAVTAAPGDSPAVGEEPGSRGASPPDPPRTTACWDSPAAAPSPEPRSRLCTAARPVPAAQGPSPALPRKAGA